VTASDLIPFTSHEFGDVRATVDAYGGIWWVAQDVCRALDIINTSKALNGLDTDEKMTLTNSEGHSGQRGGAQFLNYVNEPGLYSLVLRSRKPRAKAFRRWITHEVIPALRRTGRYELPGIPTGRRDEMKAGLLSAMADSGLYPDASAATFRAKAYSLLSGEPLAGYLPPVPGDGRDLWLTPTDLAAEISLSIRRAVSPKRVGMILKATGLHGSQDAGHAHSWPYHNICPHTHRQVLSYRYDPSVVMPVLTRHCGGIGLAPLPRGEGDV
jgi:prophage antirepressor-like protein